MESTDDNTSNQLIMSATALIDQLGAGTQFLNADEWTNSEALVISAAPLNVGYVFRYLCDSLWAEKSVESSRRDILLRLLVKCIHSETTMAQLLLELTKKSNTVAFPEISSDDSRLEVGHDELIRLLISIPDLVGNLFGPQSTGLGFQLPAPLTPSDYFPRLCHLIYMTIYRIIGDIRNNELCPTFHGYRMHYLSHLIGRLSLGEQGTVVWECIIRPTLEDSTIHSDLISLRVLCKLLIDHQKDSYLEHILRSIVSNCRDRNQLLLLVPVSDIIKSDGLGPQLRYLITNKFLVISHSEDNNLLANIFALISQDSALFLESINRILSVWGSKMAVKFASYQQHFYICRSLIIASHHFDTLLSQLEADELAQLRQSVMGGVGVYCGLMAETSGVRENGLFTGECLVARLKANPPENPLSFELDLSSNESLLQLKQLFDGQFDLDDLTATTKLPVAQKLDQISNLEQRVATIPDLDSDDDDDDDYKACDMSHDIPLNHNADLVQPNELLKDSQQRVNFLRDVLWALTESPSQRNSSAPANQEHSEAFVLECIKRIPTLVSAEQHTARELGVELARAVFSRQSTQEDAVDYTGARYVALVSLCAASPVNVTRFLLNQFHSENLSIRQRLDILEVVGAAAKKIAYFAPIQSRQESDAASEKVSVSEIERLKSLSFLDSTDAIEDKEPEWKAIIQKRLDEKTRYFGDRRLANKRSEVKGRMNEFGPVASHFFYPLIDTHKTGLSKLWLDETGEMDFLQVRIIHTLGIVIHCATNASQVMPLATSFIEYLWPLRYHTDASIRKAVLFGYMMTLTSVPVGWLFDSHSEDVTQLGNWTREIAEKDPHEDLVAAAKRCALLLAQLYEEHTKYQNETY